MADPYGIGIDRERLERQETFLLDRAKAHDIAKDDARLGHAACAASLTRDAAAVAVIRGNAERAAGLFGDAGRRFAGLGLFVGYSLLELSRSGAGWNLVSEDGVLAQIQRVLFREEAAPPSESSAAPFLFESMTSPRQLLHLYQALSIKSTVGDVRGALHELILRFPSLSVSTADVPLVRYLALMDEVERMEPRRVDGFSRDVGESLFSIFIRREEQMSIARSDTWHWKMLLNPTDVIDPDLMMLSMMMIERTGSTAAIDRIARERGPLVSMPVIAANLLHDVSRYSY
jgi:hypothetical protein